MKRDIRLASYLLLMIVLSFVLLTGWQTWSTRERTLRALNTDIFNLNQALDSYTENVVRQCEVLLLAVVDRVEHDGLGPAQLESLNVLFGHEQAVLSQISSISLYGAQGEWLLLSNGVKPANTDGADREFFIHHRDNPSRNIFIGPPIRSRSTGQWVITVSRRIDDAAGKFAGVVLVTLGVENFLNLYGKINIGQQGAISLTYLSGQTLVRYPFRERDMGRDLSNSPLFTRYLKEANFGTASTKSMFDGVERMYSFRKNDRYPLVTTVAVGRSEVLQDWRNQSLLNTAIVLALLVMLGVIGRRLLIDIRKRTGVSQQLGIAQAEVLEINEKLRVLAAHDGLTGLANRRCFDETLTTEMRRCARDGVPLSLLLIDIDYFKRYNDRYGHVAGDECLQRIAQRLAGCVRRPGDLVARYGGEELVIILPNTDGGGALAVAHVVLEGLAEEHIEHLDSPFGVVTASVGVASTQSNGKPRTALDLVAAADAALYRAKDNGRNCIETDAADT